MYLITKSASPVKASLKPNRDQDLEQFVLNLFDRPGLATALMNFDGIVFKCNPRLHELLGTTKAEMIRFAAYVHPDDREIDRDFKQKLLAGEMKSYTIEKRLVTRNNEIIWVNATLSRIDGFAQINGDRPCLALLLEDITETKKIYNALIRMEGKWDAVVLQSLNFFIQTSSTGQIINVSSAVERILGYPEAELLGLSILDFIHPSDFNVFASALRLWASVPHTQEPGLECRWRTKSSGWVYMCIQGQKFPSALEIDGVSLSGYDMTPCKQLEADLKATEERFKSLFVNLPGVVFRCDSTYAMNFISDGIEAITGYPASEFINDRIQSFFDLIHPDDSEYVKRSLIQCIFKRQSGSTEYRILHTDGSIHWVLERKQAVFDQNGSLLGFDGILLDMSRYLPSQSSYVSEINDELA